MPKNPPKQKLTPPKKIILVLAFSLFFSFSAPKEADAWLSMAAQAMAIAEKNIMYVINGMTMGAMQQAAIKMISKQANNFISGVSGNGARFITNWEDYLIDNPKRNAQRYANDYISNALSGRGSSSYKKASNSVLGASTMAGEGFGKEAVLGDASDLYAGESYQEKIAYMVQDTVIEPKEWQVYSGEPSEMFESPNLAAMNDYIDKGLPADIQMNVATEYHTKLAEEKTIAATEANANAGFISEKTADGLVTKPGKLFQELQANIDNLPNLAISGATSIGQLAAATVSSAISGMFNKAISGVEKTINREATKVTNKATQQVNKQVNAYGPGALYGN
jgi:hypothetical protein